MRKPDARTMEQTKNDLCRRSQGDKDPTNLTRTKNNDKPNEPEQTGQKKEDFERDENPPIPKRT